MKIVCYGNTDTGLVRDHNEDSFFISDTEPLYVVADGMGGHNCGEVASRIAVETISEFYNGTAGDEAVDLVQKGSRSRWPFRKRKRSAAYEELRLETAIQEANRRIMNIAKEDADKKGMGTTLVAAYFTGGGVFIGHVGDSRCYRFRNGKLDRITADHSLANEYVRLGIISPEDVETFAYRNVIVRALGLSDTVQVDVARNDLESGDLYLFCSDGLSDMLKDQEICRVLNESDDVEAACEELIEGARKAGGADNITIVLSQVEWEEGDQPGYGKSEVLDDEEAEL